MSNKFSYRSETLSGLQFVRTATIERLKKVDNPPQDTWNVWVSGKTFRKIKQDAGKDFQGHVEVQDGDSKKTISIKVDTNLPDDFAIFVDD